MESSNLKRIKKSNKQGHMALEIHKQEQVPFN